MSENTYSAPALSTEGAEIVEKYLAEQNVSNKSQLNHLFWETVRELMRDRSKDKPPKLSLRDEGLLFDFGILAPTLLEDGEAAITGILASNPPFGAGDNIYSFSEWMEREYLRIMQFDRKAEKKEHIKRIEGDITRKREELQGMQDERKALCLERMEKMGLNLGQKSKLTGKVEQIRAMEDLFYQITMVQKEISGGKFLESEEKRKLLAKNQDMQKLRVQYDNLVPELRDQAVQKEVRAFTDDIAALIKEIVDLEARQKKAAAELDAIFNASETISPLEIEQRMNETVDYLRSLMMLSSKRVRIEPLSALTGKSQPVTKAQVREVLVRVKEFDPRLFRNDRVKYLGQPSFVIVPGYGKGVYDWKNNAIILPTVPHGKLEESVYYGIAEYRLDCDEDKVMIEAYNALLENKAIKSTFRIKEKFSKEYIKFMTMETRGYRVLDKNARSFMNREVAPARNEVRVPLEYDPISMTNDEFKRLTDRLREKFSDGSASPGECFGLGVIETYHENMEKAIEALTRAVEEKPEFLDALYNLGIVHMKKQNRKEAVVCFSTFIQKSPPSWWSAVCQEYVMKLR